MRQTDKISFGLKTFLLLTLYFLWLEIAIPFKISVFKVFLLISVVLFFVKLLFDGRYMIRGKIRFSKVNLLLFFILGLYIVIDLIGMIYSPVKTFAFTKYAVVIPMVVLILMFYFTIETKQDINNILLAMGLGSITIALYTLLAYFVFTGIKVSYYTQLSLIKDYNISSTLILMGAVITLIMIIQSKFQGKTKFILFTLVSIICSPVIYLSGSRRSLILIFAEGAAIVLYYLFASFRDRKKFTKTIGLTIIMLIFTSLSVIGTQTLLKTQSQEIKKDKILNPMHENDLSVKYESLQNGRALVRREYIWGLAFKDIKNSNFKQKLIGKGSSYDCYMYTYVYEKEMNSLYSGKVGKLGDMHPHNGFLSDLLNGGIVKLIVSIGVWIAVLIQLIVLLSKDIDKLMLVLLSWGTIFSNMMMSGRYGYIYYKEFWMTLLITFIFIELKNYNNKISDI
ncbi:O-antigen ligase family protein [Clostridium botulinum]|uniref:Membrane protein n=1 Tax=Clostridium botulinum TaxID=1491 RepID=A0A9Q1UWG9_CLOBO|nr:O-antigen ligase family protein [Clostridium botulinum]KEI00523.1 membrane protein [Clostridium botulinum C/D str. Sp77]KEI02186.1 membrane protein [Clostridium botulinum D str. 16868]KLU76414.1 membrane protein [Clostridium botulinum V891]KOA72982.1 membrane protein [Clostridium botulinum]KOA78855.1 membrane protein [Clostridium botulinum]